MIKSVTYDKEFKRKSMYLYEHNLVHKFHGSHEKPMCIEYDSVHGAERARASIVRYIHENRMPLGVTRNNRWLFVWRKEAAE